MEGPKVITSTYDFIKWTAGHIERFPNKKRYTVGETIEKKLLYILDLLIEAQYSSDKVEKLKKCNLGIEQLRYLFRLSFDLRLINLKTYELSSKYLLDIGMQVGGWIKQQIYHEKASPSF